MKKFDVIVVGGGPAGSTCARYLHKAGATVLVLDKERFPRLKLCAGWVTPGAMEDFELTPEAYPHRINTFNHLQIHAKKLAFKLKTVQHSVRRYEFDEFLLLRSGAQVETHTVREVARDGTHFVVDGRFSAPYVVGAGGTRCPIYRQFFKDTDLRPKAQQIATLECEFPYEWRNPDCHLWFFENELPGYSWYVPKANGYLNVGVGGMAQKLKATDMDIKTHWREFVNGLHSGDFVDANVSIEPKGYSYYLRTAAPTVYRDGVYLAGDAIGLATCDFGEGIGPAAQSGRLVAESILRASAYNVLDIDAYSPIKRWISDPLNYLFRRKERALLRSAAV